jgi:hypothetical protein
MRKYRERQEYGQGSLNGCRQIVQVPEIADPRIPHKYGCARTRPTRCPNINYSAAATHTENIARSLREHQAVVGLVVRLHAGYLTDECRIRDIGAPAPRQVQVLTSPGKVYAGAQGSVGFVTGRDSEKARYIHAA